MAKKIVALLVLVALVLLPAQSLAQTQIKTTGITDGAITTAKLAGDSVTAGKIVDGAVGTAEIDANAVTSSEMADNAIGSAEITDGTVAASDLATTLDLSGKTLTLPGSLVPYLEYRDEKAAGTAGGTATSGSFQTRTINVEAADAGGHGSVSANQVTLAAGTYECFALVPGAGGVNQFQAKLRNVTDSTDTLIGTSAVAGGGNIMAHSFISGRFTIAGAKAFEVQMRVNTTTATNGWGFPANLGVTEVYTVLRCWKVG